MGNQPSSPAPQPTQQTPPPLPPLPPPCDIECQKQKKLVLLKKAFDSADPDSDPEGYEKARIAYYTLLNGPGWLAEEKQRVASQEVEPVLNSYQQQYDALKGEQQSQSIFTNLANALKAQEGSDKESNSFLQKQLTLEKDKVNVSDRLNQLNGISSQLSQYLSIFIDVIIAILGFFILYKIYIRFFGQTIMSSSVDLTSV